MLVGTRRILQRKSSRRQEWKETAQRVLPILTSIAAIVSHQVNWRTIDSSFPPLLTWLKHWVATHKSTVSSILKNSNLQAVSSIDRLAPSLLASSLQLPSNLEVYPGITLPMLTTKCPIKTVAIRRPWLITVTTRQLPPQHLIPDEQHRMPPLLEAMVNITRWPSNTILGILRVAPQPSHRPAQRQLNLTLATSQVWLWTIIWMHSASLLRITITLWTILSQ